MLPPHQTHCGYAVALRCPAVLGGRWVGLARAKKIVDDPTACTDLIAKLRAHPLAHLKPVPTPPTP